MRTGSAFALLILSLFVCAATSSADVVCGKVKLKKNKPKLIARTVDGPACPKGFTVLIDTSQVVSTLQGPPGPKGDQGAPGADGVDGIDGADATLGVYGDGSAGAFVQSTNQTFDRDNLNFTDFTVDPGAILTVPSGTVIRCTGTFINNGLIAVSSFAGGEDMGLNGALATTPQVTQRGAHPGIGRTPAGSAEFGDNSASRAGGDGGSGVGNQIAARSLLLPGPIGGGGGGSRRNGFAPAGGGTFSVLCNQGIINNGTIAANGLNTSNSGSGGGGGGIIVLASKTSVELSDVATISANGGNGGPANASTAGAGGGGGGGLIYIAAPNLSIPVPANLSVAGGNAGNSVTVTANPRSGGGGGGGSIGSGGDGATVETNGSSSTTPAEAGAPGLILTDLIDPTNSF